MQMHDSKASSTRSSGTISSSAVKPGYHSGNNGQVSSSASNRTSSGTSNSNSNNDSSGSNNNIDKSKVTDHTHQKRGKKKSNRDRQQPTKDDKSASVMSNLSSYSYEDDDHIDDQETINVGELINELENDLETEKIENEQANINVKLENNSKYSNNSTTPSSTSQLATSGPSSSTPSSSFPTHSTPNKTGTVNRSQPNQLDNIKTSTRPTNNQKSGTKKDNVVNNATNASGSSNNVNNISSRTVFKSSADERGELKMKITRETKTGKNDHKIVTSPNQKLPTSSSGSNATNLASNFEENSPSEPGSTLAHYSSSISSTKECGTSTSIGTITEPDCLGPCEPGTSVTLEGIVWQETEGGILVVNVTWRGKTYVGALLDCTRHDWAPPRLCDSPASDIDTKTSKGVRAKRIVTRSNGIGLDEKNLLQTTGKLRNGKGRRIPTTNEPMSCSKKQRESSDKSLSESSTAQAELNAQQVDNEVPVNTGNPCRPTSMDTTSNITSDHNQLDLPQESDSNSLDKTGPESPTLIGCNEPNCNKKYRNMNGLLYHQSHAHSSENELPANQNDCSSSSKDKNIKDVDEDTLMHDRTSLQEPNMHISSNSDQIVREEKVELAQPPKPLPQAQKRERSPSPDESQRFSNTSSNELTHYIPEHRPRLNDSPRITAVRNINQERRNSGSFGYISNAPRGSEHGRKSPATNQKHHLYDPQGHSTSSSSGNPQMNIQSSLSKSSSKQANPQPSLPAPTEEGMKPSGTSTGPPPAPHQANLFFNPAFIANSMNPYALPPYFPRHMYDPISPLTIPTSNTAFLTRFMNNMGNLNNMNNMNNMRVPPPPDSPSRLSSPSMPKSVQFPPYKPEPGPLLPHIPTSHPLPHLSPINNSQIPVMQVPALPLSMPGVQPNMRMPSSSDPILPPSSQPPPFSMLGMPGMPGNPLRPLGGPQVPNLVDDSLAKQFPRRY